MRITAPVNGRICGQEFEESCEAGASC